MEYNTKATNNKQMIERGHVIENFLTCNYSRTKIFFFFLFGYCKTLLGTWRGLTMMLLPDPTDLGPRLTPVSDFAQLPSFGSVRASGGVSLFCITSDSPSVPWAHFSAASSPPVTVDTEEDLPCSWVVTSSTVLACLEELSLRGAAGGFLLLWTIKSA